MKTNKLSEMAKDSPFLTRRVGKFFESIVLEIIAAKKAKDYEAQMVLESIFNEGMDSIKKNDFALFEEAERDYSKCVFRK